jgi:hypothetical protein
LKPALRFVIFRLWVPVLAASVVFSTTAVPRGRHPWGVPSSKSWEMTDCAAAGAAKARANRKRARTAQERSMRDPLPDERDFFPI